MKEGATLSPQLIRRDLLSSDTAHAEKVWMLSERQVELRRNVPRERVGLPRSRDGLSVRSPGGRVHGGTNPEVPFGGRVFRE